MSKKIAWRVFEGDKCIKSYEFKDLIEESPPFSYIQLFNSSKESLKLQCQNYALSGVKAHPNMDTVKGVKAMPDDDIFPAIEDFNMRFFSLSIVHDSKCTCALTVAQPRQNAFSLMMACAKQNASQDRPTLIADPKTKKDELHNEFLKYCSENSFEFPSNKGRLPSKLVTLVVDLMFYVDAHYEGMKNHTPGYDFPDVFKKRFSGFNKPESHGHRKRQLSNLSCQSLSAKTNAIQELLMASDYMNRFPLANLKMQLTKLVDFCSHYCTYLRLQQKRVKIDLNQPKEQQKTELEQKTDVFVCKINKEPSGNSELRKIEQRLSEVNMYTPVPIREVVTPGLERRRVHELLDIIKSRGLNKKAVLYIHHVGGNKQNVNCLWTIDDSPIGETIKKCSETIERLKQNIPKYERKITKRAFIDAYGCYASKACLRAMFASLTNDASAPQNLNEKEINERFEEALSCEDPSIVYDLRHSSKTGETDRFKVFFAETEKYLNDDVAVHERRHNQQLYLAKATSVRDLHTRVKERVPEGTPVPSMKWLSYQFQPINPHLKTARYFTGKINIKRMVQKRQVNHFLIFFFHKPNFFVSINYTTTKLK